MLLTHISVDVNSFDLPVYLCYSVRADGHLGMISDLCHSENLGLIQLDLDSWQLFD